MARILLAFPVSAAVALLLFGFMAMMVDSSHRSPERAAPALSFNMVMVPQETEVSRRQRSLPEKPPTPVVPQQPALPRNSMPQTQPQPMDIQPVSALDMAVSGVPVLAPQLSRPDNIKAVTQTVAPQTVPVADVGSDQQAMPLYRVEPRYPSRALRRKTEGFVLMRFTIDKTGQPTDIEVLEAQPARVFEREAVRALKRWKYQPKTVAGKSVEQPGQTVRLEFKLAK